MSAPVEAFLLCPDPMLIITPDARIADANRAAEGVLGLTQEALRGLSVERLVHPDDSRLCPAIFTPPHNSQSGTRQVLRMATPDGYCALEWHVAALNDGRSFLAVGREERARARCDVARCDSDERYRALLEHADDAILVASSEYRFIDANERAVEMFGYSRAELSQLGPLDLYPPEEQAAVRAAFRAIDGKTRRLFEHRACRKDGRLLLVEVSGTRVPCGNTSIYLGVFRDITERKLAEERLRRSNAELEAIFASVNVHIAVMDTRFNLLKVNDAYAAATGCSAEALVGQNHFQRCPGAELQRRFERVVATGVADRAMAVPYIYPEGSGKGTSWWDWSLAPMRGKQGRVDGLVLTSIDATERELQRQSAEAAWRASREELAQRVLERTTELEAANRELESFSYSIAHDLRAPLRAINGFSAALGEDCPEVLNSLCATYLERIRNATLQMSQLIDGLLMLSQVFRSEMVRVETDLSDVARKVATQLEAGSPGRAARVAIAPGLRVVGDGALLHLLLQNLLENAWKFTSTTPNPLIEFGRVEQEGRSVYFVRDNGIGFEPAYARKIFEPFERLHGKVELEGTGIGLATVRRIVQRHGGEVWAEAAPGQGATIYFTLAES